MLVSNLILGRYVSLPKWRDTWYELQITNLDEIEVEFEIRCSFLRDSGWVDAWRYVEGRFGDLNTQPTMITPFRWNGKCYSGSFNARIRPRVCGLFRLRVFPPQKMQHSYDRDYELTGFVELLVPRQRQPGTLLLGPQVDHNVPVLLNARKNDYRIPDYVLASDRPVWTQWDGWQDFGRTLEGDDYSSEGITLASGKAENEIVPQGSLLTQVAEIGLRAAALRAAITDNKQNDLAGARGLDDDNRLAALLDLLTELDGEPRALETINELLRETGSRVRLDRNSQRD